MLKQCRKRTVPCAKEKDYCHRECLKVDLAKKLEDPQNKISQKIKRKIKVHTVWRTQTECMQEKIIEWVIPLENSRIISHCIWYSPCGKIKCTLKDMVLYIMSKAKGIDWG